GDSDREIASSGSVFLNEREHVGQGRPLHGPLADAVKRRLTQSVTRKCGQVDGRPARAKCQGREVGSLAARDAQAPVLKVKRNSAGLQALAEFPQVVGKHVQADGGELVGGSLQYRSHQAWLEGMKEAHGFDGRMP